MAQTLEMFEETVQPLIPASVAADFKAFVRRKLNALAVDACDMIALDEQGMRQNGAAQDLKDRLFPDTRAR